MGSMRLLSSKRPSQSKADDVREDEGFLAYLPGAGDAVRRIPFFAASVAAFSVGQSKSASLAQARLTRDALFFVEPYELSLSSDVTYGLALRGGTEDEPWPFVELAAAAARVEVRPLPVRPRHFDR